MTPRKFKRVTRKMAFERYNNILKSARQVEKSYGVKRIPVTLIKEIIASAMFEKVQDKNLQKFVKQFNKTLDMVLMFSADNGKAFGDNCVSRNELKQWIDTLKTSFINGQNEIITKP